MIKTTGIANKLLKEVCKIGGFKTKDDALLAALREYVRHSRRMDVLKLVGQVEYYDDYDYKSLRRGKKQ